MSLAPSVRNVKSIEKRVNQSHMRLGRQKQYDVKVGTSFAIFSLGQKNDRHWVALGFSIWKNRV